MTPKHTLLGKALVCFYHSAFCVSVGATRVKHRSLLSFPVYSVLFLLCDHGTSMKTVLHINEVFFSCNHVLESKRI